MFIGRRARAFGFWGVLIVFAGLTPGAAAQTGAGAGVSRAARPSLLVERVGGRYTRSDADTNFGGQIPQVSTGSRSLGLPRRAGIGNVSSPAPLRLGPAYQTYQANLVPSGRFSSEDLRQASLFTLSTRVDTPPGGWGLLNVLPLTDLPEVATARQGSRFHQAFGLEPTEESAGVGERVTYADVCARLDLATTEKIREDREQALRWFREATSPSVDPLEQSRVMRRASALLNNVRRLDPKDALVCVLLAHGALAKGHGGTALGYLAGAVQRDPNLFSDLPKVASHFGDYDEQTGRSALLESQVREMLRGISGTASLESLTLEAYCTWVLGDTVRFNAAVAKAHEQLLRTAGDTGSMATLINAMRYGSQGAPG